MSVNVSVKSSPITIWVDGEPYKGKLFTSYTGNFFLRKNNQWVEVSTGAKS